MSGPLRVLIVEDSPDDTLLIAAELQRGGLVPVYERVETAVSLQAALDAHEWDVIICDYSMPHLTAPAALVIYQRKGVDIPLDRKSTRLNSSHRCISYAVFCL